MGDAVSQDAETLRHAHKDICWDADVVVMAVRQNGLVLELAHRTLREDKDIVLEAVQQNGEALNFASEELREDPEVVLDALQQSWRSLRLAPETLRADGDFMRKAVQLQPRTIRYADEDLQPDLKLLIGNLPAAKVEAEQREPGKEPKPPKESTYGAAMVFGEESGIVKRPPRGPVKAHDEYAQGFWANWPLP